MCAKPGKILSSPKMVRVIHSPSTLSVRVRKQYKYLLKCAIRRSVDDMNEILNSGNERMAAFVMDELARVSAAPRWARMAQNDTSDNNKPGMDLEDKFW